MLVRNTLMPLDTSAQSLQAPVAGRVMTLAAATDGSTHARQARAFAATLKRIVIADAHGKAVAAQQLMQDVYQRLGDLTQTVEVIDHPQSGWL